MSLLQVAVLQAISDGQAILDGDAGALRQCVRKGWLREIEGGYALTAEGAGELQEHREPRQNRAVAWLEGLRP